jgi:putative glutamine amidotransferase
MKRPLIGIATSHSIDITQAGPLASVSVPKEYCIAIEQASGTPVLLPTTGADLVPDLISMVHGLLLIGGEDVDSSMYAEPRAPSADEPNRARDKSEIAMVREALRVGKPVLGVCRGAQLLNVSLGGSLHQSLPNRPIDHWGSFGPSHEVALMPDTTLQRLYGVRELTVNSYHRQAVKDVAPALRISAVSVDGVIEAVEDTQSETGALGVQWHPEQDISQDGCLFSWLVAQAS